MSERLLRVKQVLEIIPVSKTTWYEGIKAGKFPSPKKLGPKTSVWRLSEIEEIVDSVGRGAE